MKNEEETKQGRLTLKFFVVVVDDGSGSIMRCAVRWAVSGDEVESERVEKSEARVWFKSKNKLEKEREGCFDSGGGRGVWSV